MDTQRYFLAERIRPAGLLLGAFLAAFGSLRSNDVLHLRCLHLSGCDVLDGIWERIRAHTNPASPVPLLLLLFKKTGGITGIWLFQLACWLVTINFTHRSIRQRTNSRIFAAIGSLIVIGNFSLIALTLHALTEVVSTFLLSALVYFVVTHRKRMQEVRFLHGILLLLSLLTVVKPLFFWVTMAGILIATSLFYGPLYLYW